MAEVCATSAAVGVVMDGAVMIVCALPAAVPVSLPVVVTALGVATLQVMVWPAVGEAATSAITRYRRAALKPVWPYIVKPIGSASAFVLDTTPDTVLDSEWVRAINARLTLTAAMKPGVLRVDGEPVWVDTMSGRYSPGTPDPTELEDIMEQAESSESNVFAASRLFARLARMQPFGDGNKRTAMLAANGLLIKRDSPYMLAVPVEGHDRDVFVRGLGRWYVHGDDEVVGWLAEWNLTNPD